MKIDKIIFPVKILQIKSLNATQKLILGVILYSMYKKEVTWISNGYIGHILSMTNKRISENVSKLEEVGIIKIYFADKDGIKNKRHIALNKKFEHYSFIKSCVSGQAIPQKRVDYPAKTDPPAKTGILSRENGHTIPRKRARYPAKTDNNIKEIKEIKGNKGDFFDFDRIREEDLKFEQPCKSREDFVNLPATDQEKERYIDSGQTTIPFDTWIKAERIKQWQDKINHNDE